MMFFRHLKKVRYFSDSVIKLSLFIYEPNSLRSYIPNEQQTVEPTTSTVEFNLEV